jgi:hypothetical protein
MDNKHWITNIHILQNVKYAINLGLCNQQLKRTRNKIHYTVASIFVEVKMTTSSRF